jgi:ABC-type sugar transport system ATPase subunit
LLPHEKDAGGSVLHVSGRETDFMPPFAEARDAGIVYLTKDRKAKGLLMEQGMRPNMTLLRPAEIHPPVSCWTAPQRTGR